MTVPSELVGAWRRSGLLINGVRQLDFCDVLWLQTPTWFADIRLRLTSDLEPTSAALRRMSRVTATAGTADWADPFMTWNGSFGPRRETSPDTYRLRWRDNVVIESGSIRAGGETFTFAEEWLRMSTGSDETALIVRDRYLYIAIGRWAIEVSSPAGDDRLIAIRSDLSGDHRAEVGSVQLS